MPGQFHHAAERPQSVSNEHDLYDDATRMNPIALQETPTKLHDRFMSRLARITATTVKGDKHESQDFVNFYLSRAARSPQPNAELRQLLDSMEQSLSTIAAHPDSPRCKEAADEMWRAMLIYANLNIDHIVQGINRIFADNKETFEDFLTRYFGLDAFDANDSKIDENLGQLIISLHHKTLSYDQSIKQLSELIDSAFTMTRDIDHLRQHLCSLLQKPRFANELYDLICTLGSPRRARDTFVQTAKLTKTFANLTFHLASTSISSKRVRSAFPPTRTSSTSTGSSLDPARKRLPTPITLRSKIVCSPTPTISTVSSPNKHDALAVVRACLDVENQTPGLSQLQPVSNQEATQLIQVVLRDQLLPISCSAWYSFGFVTTRNEEEERKLGGLYAAIIREAQSSTAIFRELVQALETNTLVKLFDIKEYSHFCQLFPRLESFLKTPAKKRSTVWRLIQYIRTKDFVDPPPILKRDYGYQFCKNHQEVVLLNDMYDRILREISPKELHGACVHGRIAEFAQQKGMHIEPKNRRFLKNDYGHPDVGFDNDGGLERHQWPLFKKALKPLEL